MIDLICVRAIGATVHAARRGVLLVLLAAGAASSVAAPPARDVLFVERPGEREFSGRLLVRPRAAKRAAARAILAGWTDRPANVVGEYVIELVGAQTENDVAATLLATGCFEYVEPDWRVAAVALPDDPQYAAQWHLPSIGAPAAWDITTGVPEVIIAICDSGIDLDHPDLAAQLMPGFNAVDALAQVDGGAVDGLTDHGTQVAGSAAALSDNGTGVTGVAWNVRLMPVRVSNLPDDMALISTLNDGARWAVDHGASIVNVSFSAATSASVATTGAYIRDHGGIYVWAAGNAASSLGAADPADVLIVAATDQAREPATFTNHGAAIDVSAPGVDIVTTQLGGYGAISGTSFASPITAGVLALIRSVHPRATPTIAEAILVATADDLGAAGEDDDHGHGGINAAAAVTLASAAATGPVPPLVFDDRSALLGTDGASIDVLANDVDPNGDPLMVSAFEAMTEEGGAISRDGTALRYEPAPGFEGLDAFSYTAQDPGGDHASGTVRIAVATPPSFDAPFSITAPGSSTGQDVVSGDFDGDGDPDVVVAHLGSFQTLQLFRNVGGALTDAGTVAIDLFESPRLTVGEFTGDAHLDLVIAARLGNVIGVLPGRGDFTFDPMIAASLTQPAAIASASRDGRAFDADGDGHSDLLVASAGFPTQVRIMRGLGDGTFTTHAIVDAFDPPADAALADMDGDGDLDAIVTGAGFGGAQIIRLDANGHAEASTSLTAGGAASALDIADVDRDGALDVVIAHSGSLGVPGTSILHGDGAGGFAETTFVPTAVAFPSGIAARDFDGDGDVDLALAHLVGAALTVHPGLADGSVLPVALVVDTVTGLNALAALDVDGDGDHDLLAPRVSIQFNREVIQFRNHFDPAPGDLDLDGDVDFNDLLALLAAWGSDDPRADLDGSGIVDFTDVVLLLAAWS